MSLKEASGRRNEFEDGWRIYKDETEFVDSYVKCEAQHTQFAGFNSKG